MTFVGANPEPRLAVPAITELFDLSCDWLIPNVCTAPPCVEKAYAEACALVDELMLEAA